MSHPEILVDRFTPEKSTWKLNITLLERKKHLATVHFYVQNVSFQKSKYMHFFQSNSPSLFFSKRQKSSNFFGSSWVLFFSEGSYGCWPSLPGSIGTSLRLDAELLRRLPSAWCCLDGRQHGQLEAGEIRGDRRIAVETLGSLPNKKGWAIFIKRSVLNRFHVGISIMNFFEVRCLDTMTYRRIWN